jgi:DNA-binding GntR family transcriptional regulator
VTQPSAASRPVPAAPADDEVLDRAETVAAGIRAAIISGEYTPGSRLSEAALVDAFGVSRNTLREALRMLTQEGLLVRRPHAGVIVAVPSLASIIDIYRVRRMIEGQALRAAPPRHPAGRAMAAAVDVALAAREAGDWAAVGTANMEFHRAIVSLADSARLDRVYANVSAELRLAFGLVDDPEYLHAPYVDRNVSVLRAYTEGRSGEAADDLDAYLAQSERTLLAAYARHDRDGS